MSIYTDKDLIDLVEIVAGPIQRAVDFDMDDSADFERWLDTERGWPFTDCHACLGDIGSPRKWFMHDCLERARQAMDEIPEETPRLQKLLETYHDGANEPIKTNRVCSAR